MMPNVLTITLADAGKASLGFLWLVVAISAIVIFGLPWCLPGKKPGKGA